MKRLDSRLFAPAATLLCAWLTAVPLASAEDAAPTQRIVGLERQIGEAGAGLRIEMAQLFNRPPADIPEGEDWTGDTPPVRHVQDAAGLDIRVDKLENQMRSLTGQIEQTQFEIRRLEDELKKFHEDADLRSPDPAPRPAARPVPQKRADLDPPASVSRPNAEPPAAIDPAPADAMVPRPKRGDAFDPAADPNAPGAPHTLGTLPGGTVASPAGPIAVEPDVSAAGVPLDTDPNAPLDLSNGAAVPAHAAPLPPPAVVASTGVPGPAALTPGSAGPPLAGNARDEFDAALAQFKQGQYETAQTSFDLFVQKYPKDRLVADALYYLGETYSQRGRYREAAEQYLKVATDFSRSSRAPEGLVRLGVSLNALGAKEQACATFGEVSRKYPNASVVVKASVDRELKRAKC